MRLAREEGGGGRHMAIVVGALKTVVHRRGVEGIGMCRDRERETYE